MGQKTNARGYRLQVNKNWKSRWYSDDEQYADYLLQDIKIREFLEQELRTAGVIQVDVERTNKEVTVHLHVAKPGLVIGRGGERISAIKDTIKNFLTQEALHINVHQVKKTQMSARLLAEEIAQQLERRVRYKRAISKIMSKVSESAGIKGMLVCVSGRLDGVAIARTEKRSFGSVPLQTINANIDYAHVTAKTKFGLIGIKVWLHKEEEKKYA